MPHKKLTFINLLHFGEELDEDPGAVGVAVLAGQVEGRHAVPVLLLQVQLVGEEAQEVRMPVQRRQVHHGVQLFVALLMKINAAKLTINGRVIYTAPYVMILMRANPL